MPNRGMAERPHGGVQFLNFLWHTASVEGSGAGNHGTSRREAWKTLVFGTKFTRFRGFSLAGSANGAIVGVCLPIVADYEIWG